MHIHEQIGQSTLTQQSLNPKVLQFQDDVPHHPRGWAQAEHECRIDAKSRVLMPALGLSCAPEVTELTSPDALREREGGGEGGGTGGRQPRRGSQASQHCKAANIQHRRIEIWQKATC